MGPTYERFYADSYDKALTVTQITAKIRADVKAAAAAGDLPADLTYRVYKRSSGSINIQVSGMPDAEAKDERHERETGFARPSEKARMLTDKLRELGGAYNFSSTDIQFDWFDQNYYLNVEILDEDRTEWDKQERARQAALRAARKAA